MLVPMTRRRTSPMVRTTSSVSPHANSIEAIPWRPVRIFRADVAMVVANPLWQRL